MVLLACRALRALLVARLGQLVWVLLARLGILARLGPQEPVLRGLVVLPGRSLRLGQPASPVQALRGQLARLGQLRQQARLDQPASPAQAALVLQVLPARLALA